MTARMDMTTKMTPEQCAEWFVERDNFLILTHIRPDGDTIGSAAALCLGLRDIGKTAYLYDNPQITDKYRPYFDPYAASAQVGFRPDFTVSVDTASTNMLPEGFTGAVDLSIDHHTSNSYYAAETFVRGNRSSCGEMVYELLRTMAVPIDKEIANLLYIAVSSDTGCFSYGNTTAFTLRAASELVALGADSTTLNKLFFRTATPARIALEGMVYSSISLHQDGKIAAALITLEMTERAKATEADFEDIANLPGRIEGVCISITVRETAPLSSKVSVRTYGGVNANAICAKFGGGGHPGAAGCNLEGCTPEEAVLKLVDAAAEELL